MNSIYKIFAAIVVISLSLSIIIFYNDYQFKNNPLSKDIQNRLYKKNREVVAVIKQKYNIDLNIPVIVTDKLHNNLFGLTSYKDGKIKILLNKKRFKENENYMIESVLEHEYAHAVMFYFKNFTKVNGGHTKQWQQICFNISDNKCDRYV
jgi:hypothetical protein